MDSQYHCILFEFKNPHPGSGGIDHQWMGIEDFLGDLFGLGNIFFITDIGFEVDPEDPLGRIVADGAIGDNSIGDDVDYPVYGNDGGFENLDLFDNPPMSLYFDYITNLKGFEAGSDEVQLAIKSEMSGRNSATGPRREINKLSWVRQKTYPCSFPK